MMSASPDDAKLSVEALLIPSIVVTSTLTHSSIQISMAIGPFTESMAVVSFTKSTVVGPFAELEMAESAV